MKVLVFGATGRVGSRFVEGALKRGHQLTLFTRNIMNVRIKHKNARISGGNVSDDIAVREAVKGQDAVVVALGAKDLSKPASVCADGVKRIIAAMQLHGVKRIVMLGNIALLPSKEPGKLMGELNLPPFLQFVFVDHRNAYNLLKDSGLDFSVVCPPFMPLGAATGKYRVSVEAPLERSQSISVDDVVDFLLKEVFDAPHVGQRVGVGY